MVIYKKNKIKSSLYSLKYPFECYEWAVLISTTLRQGPHFNGCSDGESLATYGRFDRLGI